MPKSRQRKRPLSLRRSEPREPRGPGATKRWAAPLMLTCWLVGLAWVVVYYVVPDAAIFESLGGWNLVIGMGLIGLGFVFATQWE